MRGKKINLNKHWHYQLILFEETPFQIFLTVLMFTHLFSTTVPMSQFTYHNLLPSSENGRCGGTGVLVNYGSLYTKMK